MLTAIEAGKVIGVKRDFLYTMEKRGEIGKSVKASGVKTWTLEQCHAAIKLREDKKNDPFANYPLDKKTYLTLQECATYSTGTYSASALYSHRSKGTFLKPHRNKRNGNNIYSRQEFDAWMEIKSKHGSKSRKLHQDKSLIEERLKNGETYSQIADSYGCSRTAVCLVMRQDVDDSGKRIHVYPEDRAPQAWQIANKAFNLISAR